MRIKTNVTLFFATVIIFSALSINYIIIKSYTIVDTTFISSMKEIHIDSTSIDAELYDKISSLLNSGKSSVYKKLLEEAGNPASQFYGFCGFMKSNRQTSVEYLKSGILVSPKNVTIVTSQGKIEGTLGYAIVLLLKETPEWLSPQLSDDFIKLTDKLILDTYKKSDVSTSPQYQNALMALIQSKYPASAKGLVNDFATTKKVSEMSPDERKEIASMLNVISEPKRRELIKDLLKEKDPQILISALNAIKDKTYTEFGKSLENMVVNGSYTDEVKIILVDKYSLIFENEALPKLIKFMLQNEKKYTVISKCLEIFRTYGTDANWNFLTRYLGEYPVELNNQVLSVIIDLSWKTNPDNVYRTLNYCIKRSNYSTAKKAIEFYMGNNSTSSQAIILSRLRSYENDEMKLLAIKYIDTFKLAAGSDIIAVLSKDQSAEISAAAAGVLAKYGWSSVVPKSDATTD